MPESVTYEVVTCDCLMWKNTWSSSINYSKGHLVKYSSVLYIARRSNLNAQPDISASDWDSMF